MRETVVDQAMGLRQLFAQRLTRLLPLVVPDRQTAVGTVAAAGTQAGDQRAWHVAAELARFVARLAQALARNGCRPILLDGHRGLIAPSLGLQARFDLQYFLCGDLSAHDVVLSGSDGLLVLPAVRGLRTIIAQQHIADTLRLPRLLSSLQPIESSEVLTFDTALLCADAATVALLLAEQPSQSIVLYSNQAYAREQAYSAIKTLCGGAKVTHVHMVYHRFDSADMALIEHNALVKIVDRFLGIPINFAGVTATPDALAATLLQWPLLEMSLADQDPSAPLRSARVLNARVLN
jgi:hypothetical protein